ncbi:hypothetical protein C8K44_11541 [Aminobacter sp. AP02]|nr:hypothetical protein C8K44_11541 [Aminobacter sp. AP02]
MKGIVYAAAVGVRPLSELDLRQRTVLIQTSELSALIATGDLGQQQAKAHRQDHDA